MQDRHLFRAKRTDNGEWTYGYLYGIWERKYILWGMTNNVPDMTEVDPSTICQCTGLKDKTGRLILENDIIKYRGMIFVVKWNDDCAHFAAHKVREETRYTPAMNRETMEITEVIGNIFDNPELLD